MAAYAKPTKHFLLYMYMQVIMSFNSPSCITAVLPHFSVPCLEQANQTHSLHHSSDRLTMEENKIQEIVTIVCVSCLYKHKKTLKLFQLRKTSTYHYLCSTRKDLRGNISPPLNLTGCTYAKRAVLSVICKVEFNNLISTEAFFGRKVLQLQSAIKQLQII